MHRGPVFALIGALLVVGLITAQPMTLAVAQEATPAADCPATTPEEN